MKKGVHLNIKNTKIFRSFLIRLLMMKKNIRLLRLISFFGRQERNNREIRGEIRPLEFTVKNRICLRSLV